MRRKWLLIALAVAVVVAAGAGGVFALRKRSPAPAVATAPEPVAPAGEIILPGTIQARETAKVGAPVEGRLETFHVEVGDEVYEGQLLAEIKNQGAEVDEQAAELEVERLQQRVNNIESLLAAARLESSRASADSARARSEAERAGRTYEREKLLYGEGATPRRVYEKAEREFKTSDTESKQLAEVAAHADERAVNLQKDLDAARKMLEHATSEMESTKARVAAGQIVSPVNGIVTARRGAEGDQVTPAIEDLFLIAEDLSQLDVTLQATPAQVPLIKPGQQAAVVIADVPNEHLPGLVRSVENGKVVVEFANPSPLVKPAMTAQVRIKVN